MKTENTRRKFLKNTTLSALALGVLPLTVLSKEGSIDEAQACNETTVDRYGQGPFYKVNPPAISNKVLARNAEAGTRIVISGRVLDLDCNPIPDTLVDIWHADDSGAYDNVGFNLRGTTKSNAQGFYEFETIKPGKYLNGAAYRPSHIHFRITPPGKPTVITQLYFQGDTDIPFDTAASITSGIYDATHRIIQLVDRGDGVFDGTWDIAVEGDGVVDNGGTNNGEKTGIYSIHQDKGVMYKLAPNPFQDFVEIEFGVFNPAKASVVVFDMIGNQVANLKEEHFEAGKYSVSWNVPTDLPAGSYFIALKINELQVHYLKGIKM
jgi:protocatechuate 3,4-dioxygenase beta subunit|tara:strand:+ start:317 stop:1282 length:966 start_codon:yes stop_codon:yes gene_type:complete